MIIYSLQSAMFVYTQHINCTAGTAIYKDSLYGNLYVIPICYAESGI
jgi:hypothetical protein